ncbi:KilA-N domain-containing protein [Mannheimia haemolytica]|nr:KilA-N domain-containing protein [Mannheimia haemolytica]
MKNWLQNKNTIEFLQVWEELNNPNFNLVELHQIKCNN